MAELEDTIRDLASRGEITHLSLTPRQIAAGPNKTVPGWAATFSPASSYGNIFAESTDPIDALLQAVRGAKLRRKAPFKDGDGARPTCKRTATESTAPEDAPEQDLADLLG